MIVRSAAAGSSDHSLHGAATIRLPILDSVFLFLVSQSFVPIALWSSIRIKGPFDRDAATRAIAHLIRRNLSLRSFFCLPPDAGTLADYECHALVDPPAPDIRFDDLRNATADVRESHLLQLRTEFLNKAWDLGQWPLHQFVLVALGSDEFILFFANAHAIADGLATRILLQQFVEAYSACLRAETLQAPELADQVTEFETLAARMNGAALDREIADYRATSRRRGKTPYFWNPASKPRGPLPGDYRYRHFGVDLETTTQLLALAHGWDISLNSLVVGAFGQTMLGLDVSEPRFAVNVPTGGRLRGDTDAADHVGCFALNLAVEFDAPAQGTDGREFLQEIHGRIEDGILRGEDQAQDRLSSAVYKGMILRRGRLSPLLATRPAAANVFLSNLGRSFPAPRCGALELTEFRVGSNNWPDCLEVVLCVFAGRLQFDVSYDANFFAAPVVDDIFAAFRATLSRLLADAKAPGPAVRNTGDNAPRQAAQAVVAAIMEASGLSITPAEYGADLEADLGLDSLLKIRVVSRIAATLDAPVDRARLVRCRTVAEFVAELGALSTPGEAERPAVARGRHP